jgi:HPt (histidine-containing phosphotransfer) domain-containing protein
MIDWDRVEELRHEVGEDDFAEVVELFLEEVDDTIARLGHSDANASLEEQLHFLKGSALNIGFNEFARLCQDGETAAALGRAETVDLSAISKAYGAARAQFLLENKSRYAA